MMKKTLSINIRGIVFNIDEDAYQLLNDYLADINRHYKNQPGHEDIMSDIENRIVELFQQKLSDKKQVINIADVSEIIGVLGRPSDFEQELQDETPPSYSGRKRRSKRLFRDPDNRMVGGVCSGLGAYFNIDPVWFRLAFVVAVLVGGSGILVYLILWIILPPARSATDRLEMRGEPINIDNIEKAVKEEMKDVKEKFDEFAGQARQTFKKK
jgi:phage shock protein PspC (stress-responsive transcriptional regulator)